MQKRSIMMLIASSILIAGILVAGCTDSSSSVDTSSTLSPIPSLSKSEGTTPAAAADAGDKHLFNESSSQAGTRPEGMEMNGTHPSGTPQGGMQMNGTRPSGNRPEGMEMNGTRPSGTPPDGIQMGGSPPSGSPPSGS